MRKRSCVVSHLLVVFLVLIVSANALAQDSDKPEQLVPKRLSSIGDSMTEAIDAELPGANHWASWVNGYHGFWEWLFGLTNVYSHNQRITKNFGCWGRKNYMEAVSGADSFDLVWQAQQAVAHQAQYVTILMGHNDVCQNSFADIPSDAEFETNFTDAMDILKTDLPHGATVYVVGIVDIYRLWQVAQDKKALGIVDCEVLWAFTLFDLYPCGTMLNPFLPEWAREYTRERNVGFNDILERVTKNYNSNDSHHYYFYTNEVFVEEFGESDVSDIDCFHPSAKGQKRLSEITWDDGPFKAYRR